MEMNGVEVVCKNIIGTIVIIRKILPLGIQLDILVYRC